MRTMRGWSLVGAAAVLFLGLPMVAAAADPDVAALQAATLEGLDLPADASSAAGAADAAAPRSAPTETPIAFTMLGFTLPEDAPEGSEVSFRTSPDGQTWSDWTVVEPLGAEGDGPDRCAGSSCEGAATGWQRSTEPVWVGEARYVETVGVDPATLEVHLIDALGLNDDTGPVASAAARLTDGLSTLGTPSAAQAAGRPSILTRAQWGADESWAGSPVYATAARYAIVHHTAGSNTYTREQAPAVVRAIYRYHTQTLGWRDIGYNFLIDRYGTVYEGRRGGLDRPVVGAHAAGFNTGSIGVSVMGEFSASAPPTVAQDAVADVLAWTLGVHGIDPTGRIGVTSGGGGKFASGTEIIIPTIVGHRDVNATACPGTAFHGRLPALRTAVAEGLRGGTLPEPVCLSPTGQPSLTGLPRIGYETAAKQSWTAYRWYFSDASEAIVANSADYADALAGAALAGARGAPLVLTATDRLEDDARAVLVDGRMQRVTILGGSAAIAASVEAQIRTVHGSSGPTVDIERIAGADRFETATAVAEALGGDAPEVALALGQHAQFDRAWPDAMSAATLAATTDRIPTLLTHGDRLPAATRDALEALGVERVHLLGGTAAIAESVARDVAGDGYEVTRLAGADRYATSVAVAQAAADRFSSSRPPVTFAPGRSYSDALVAGAVAARRGGPLLLVPEVDLGQSVPLMSHLRAPVAPYGRGSVVVGAPGKVTTHVSLQLCEELQR